MFRSDKYSTSFTRNMQQNTRTFLLFFKSTIFLDIAPCSPLKVILRFGGTYRLHLQGRIISQQETSVKSSACRLAGLFFDPEDGGDMFLRNVG
jgi:hypothetical protein